MNPTFTESSLGLDRLATGDEVRCAFSFSSPSALELVGPYDDFSEMDPDSIGRACNLREVIDWLEVVHKMRDALSN